MPIVSLNTIKEWFSNLKKPPQEQFWAWLDSFYHKWEGIPMNGITGLINALLKKADLVDGVVPENQLPFSVQTSEIIALGSVTTTENTVNLSVHSSGSNKVRLQGKIYTRSFPNSWSFTPLSFGTIKILRGYAMPDASLFYFAEGVESDEYQEPEIPETALEVFKITVTPLGAFIDTVNEIGGFKPKASDGWRTIQITTQNYLSVTFEEATLELSASSDKEINGFITKQSKYIWNGKPFLLKNSGENDVILKAPIVEPIPNPNAKYYGFTASTNVIIKAGEYALIKIKNDEIVIVSLGGSSGSASFPEASANGLALISDSTAPEKVKWYAGFLDKLTTTAQSVVGFVTFNGNFRAKRHYFSVDEIPDTSPLKMWTDGTDYYVTDGSGVNRKIAQIGKLAEHNVRGNIYTGSVSGSFILDLSKYSHFELTLTGNTTLVIPNNSLLITESIVITLVVKGNYTLTFPNWLKKKFSSDDYDGASVIVNEITILIRNGGTTAQMQGFYRIFNETN